MRKRDYEAYLASPGWALRRAEYFGKHPKVCRGCASKRGVQLHHHTYGRVGRERDADLVPLCDGCHGLVHAYHGIGGKNLSVCTFEVVAHLNGEPVRRPRRVGPRMALALTLVRVI